MSKKIDKQMLEIVKEGFEVERFYLQPDEAVKMLEEMIHLFWKS